MIEQLEVQPHTRSGPAGPATRLDPSAGTLIKNQPGTLVWRQTLSGGTRIVVKLYLKRRPSILERIGLYTGRAEREFRALCHLEDHCVACSAPLFWARGESQDTGRYQLLATREVEGASDLRYWLKEHPGTEPPELAQLLLLTSAMHRAGLQHGAFWERNVLLAGRDYYIIDLPRSQMFNTSIEGRGPGLFDIKVLLQSLTKYLSDDILVRALAGYPRLPVAALDLVRSMRPQPLTSRWLNSMHAVYTVQSMWRRLWAAPPRRSRRL